MVKGFGGLLCVHRNPFFIYTAEFWLLKQKEEKMEKTKEEKVKVLEKEKAKADVISHRKSCDATGTGLSHYILMDKKEK
jgi:modified peptide precursor CbpA